MEKSLKRINKVCGNPGVVVFGGGGGSEGFVTSCHSGTTMVVCLP